VLAFDIDAPLLTEYMRSTAMLVPAHRRKGAAATLPRAVRMPKSHLPRTSDHSVSSPPPTVGQMTEKVIEQMRCKPDRNKPNIELLRMLSASGLEQHDGLLVPPVVPSPARQILLRLDKFFFLLRSRSDRVHAQHGYACSCASSKRCRRDAAACRSNAQISPPTHL